MLCILVLYFYFFEIINKWIFLCKIYVVELVLDLWDNIFIIRVNFKVML